MCSMHVTSGALTAPCRPACGLGRRYWPAFDEQGYDDLEYLLTLDEAQLREVGLAAEMKPGHLSKFVSWLERAAAAVRQRA